MRNGTNVMGMRAAARGRMRRATLAALTAGLGFAAACMGNTQQEQAAEPAPRTWVKVDNRAFLDMNVYVYRSAQRIRLGTANGTGTARFVIPANLLFGPTPLRFQADPIGGNRQPVSEEVTVSPGDEVVLVIPPG